MLKISKETFAITTNQLNNKSQEKYSGDPGKVKPNITTRSLDLKGNNLIKVFYTQETPENNRVP